MADKSSEEIELDKRAAERAVAHKEMKLAVGTSAHHAAARSIPWPVRRMQRPLELLKRLRPAHADRFRKLKSPAKVATKKRMTVLTQSGHNESE